MIKIQNVRLCVLRACAVRRFSALAHDVRDKYFFVEFDVFVGVRCGIAGGVGIGHGNINQPCLVWRRMANQTCAADGYAATRLIITLGRHYR